MSYAVVDAILDVLAGATVRADVDDEGVARRCDAHGWLLIAAG